MAILLRKHINGYNSVNLTYIKLTFGLLEAYSYLQNIL